MRGYAAERVNGHPFRRDAGMTTVCYTIADSNQVG